MKYNGTYLSIANLRYFRFTRTHHCSRIVSAYLGRCMDLFAQGVHPMKLVVRASIRLQTALRVVSFVIPVLAVAVAVASGGHIQPDSLKWG